MFRAYQLVKRPGNNKINEFITNIVFELQLRVKTMIKPYISIFY